MSKAEGSNDAVHPMFQQFFQAGQSMAQGFMAFLNQMPRDGGFTPPAVQLPPQAEALKSLQQEFMAQQAKLWQAMLARSQGGQPEFQVAPEAGDRRFSAPEWSESPIYDYIRQSYLLNARYLKELVEKVPLEDERAREKLRFAARQYVDALAPSNFAATNPEFVRLAVETKGKSITDGINNLLADLEKGRISMTDESVFEVGKNIATTQGAVIFENELMQLIQYEPLTAKVAKRPLLVVPPCINKFYIMDLQPENSLIRFMVEQGHTVFLVSWCNPGAEQGHLGWDDYLEQGPITAIRVVQDISRQKEINTLGFCVGGTLLASALAVLAARGEQPAASLTLLTTLLDYSDTGEIGLFIDEQFLAAREAAIGKGGLLQARELQNTFSALRPNDLIWNYVANNYLKGQKPQAFDLLYWNSDSTNLPGPFACWYMRNLYHDNSLRIPGKLEMCGVKVDLSKLEMPTYLFAAREDHIVPWHSAYQSTRLLSGRTRFVLGASGHIAGVINPASKNRRSYWIHDEVKMDSESWLGAAQEQKGSWWNDWALWIKEHGAGEKAAPKKPGNARYKAIEAAPGRYVKERVV
ncbi:class I poly(R)-hydroxyalkanoic acid synthase [Azovibrio sp.]|uniref:class I poly(R)-hydroxyalkanoic acid synthase n=1 Tax=Azovibrio sp. TaxID=1872673 RepID=UPI003C738C08